MKPIVEAFTVTSDFPTTKEGRPGSVVSQFELTGYRVGDGAGWSRPLVRVTFDEGSEYEHVEETEDGEVIVRGVVLTLREARVLARRLADMADRVEEAAAEAVSA